MRVVHAASIAAMLVTGCALAHERSVDAGSDAHGMHCEGYWRALGTCH